MAQIDAYNIGAALNLSTDETLGTLTWTAGTAPSGTITQDYKWIQVGKLVTLFFKITASVAGSTVTGVSFTLPADLPTPNTFTNQPNSSDIAYGDAQFAASNQIGTAVAIGTCALTKNGSGVYQIVAGGTSVSAVFVAGNVSYISV